MKPAVTIVLRLSQVKVRKLLPTHLVAQRAFRLRKTYIRRDNARLCSAD